MNNFQNTRKEINYEFGFVPLTGNYDWAFHLGNINEEDSLYKKAKLTQNISTEIKPYSLDQNNDFLAVGDPDQGRIDVYFNKFFSQINNGYSSVVPPTSPNQYVKFNQLFGAEVDNISGLGESIRLSENFLLAGAPKTNEEKGAVFLFGRFDSNEVGVTEDSGFGQINAISGTEVSGLLGCKCDFIESQGSNIIAASATGENEGSGSVYLYSNNGLNLINKLNLEIEGSRHYGKSLRFFTQESVRYLAIGYDYSGTGMVDMYKESAENQKDFAKYRTIQSQNAHSGDMFGYSIDNAQDSMFISCPNEFGSGAVYYYQYNSGDGFFERKERIVPDDLASGEYFGKNISFDNDDGVITSNQSSGKAYIYDYDEGPGWQHISTITGSGDFSGSFGGNVSGSFNTCLLGNVLTVGYSLENQVDYYSTGDPVIETERLISFSGVSGKIYDQGGRFIYGYSPNTYIKMHGAAFTGQYNVFVNDYLCVSKIDKEDLVINGWEISGNENFKGFELSFYNGTESNQSSASTNFSY